MTKDNLIWAEAFIAEAPVPRKVAYCFAHFPFAHVIDGELYYEPEPLGHCIEGFAATSREGTRPQLPVDAGDNSRGLG